MAAPRDAQHGSEHGERRGADAGDGLTVLRSEERLRHTVVREQASQVRLRREVVTEEIMVPVTVRREVLRVVTTDAPGNHEPAAGAGGHEPLEIVLHEERPVVTLETVAVERVRVEVVEVSGTERVQADLAREQVEVEHQDAAGWSGDAASAPGAR